MVDGESGRSGQGRFKDILKIIHLTSVLPLSNATCERAFSTMKRIKSDWRCNLSSQTLDIQMRIRVENVSLRQYDPKPAVRRWWISGERQRRPHLNIEAELRLPLQSLLKNVKQNRSSQYSSHEYPFKIMIIITCFFIKVSALIKRVF